MIPKLPRIKLKMHQRVTFSLWIISALIISYVSNSLITIRSLDDKFQIVTTQAVPLDQASTVLLRAQIDYLLRLQEIGRLDQVAELEHNKKLMSEKSKEIVKIFQSIELFSADHSMIGSVLPNLKETFIALQVTGEALDNLRLLVLTLSQKLPQQFSSLQSALEEIKKNVLYISENTDTDISTETFHIVDSTGKILSHIMRVYFSESADLVKKTLPIIAQETEHLSKAMEKLEAMDEFDSEEWDILIEAFNRARSHLLDKEKMLDNLENLSEAKSQYKLSLTQAAANSREFSEQLNYLSEATQTTLSNAGTSFGSALETNKIVSVSLSIVIFVALMLIGTILQRSIKSPLKGFRQYVDIMESGDLTQSFVLESGDEFEDIAGMLNNLTARLNQILHSIGHQAHEAEYTAEEIVVACNDLTDVLAHQVNRVQDIEPFMKTLKTASGHVSDNVSKTYARIDEVSGLTTQGTKESRHSSETVSGLKTLLTKTIESVEQLATEIVEIHGMTDLISDVADQTNLLALNAAIEAARAGSHGRGFAVVADEVRTLATSTQNTTDIIRERIEKIVARSNESKSNVNECFTIAEQAHQRFLSTGVIMEKIDLATAEVSEFTAEMNQAAKQQAESITACEESLKNIDTLAQMNSCTFESISTIMSGLAEITRELRNGVDYFKYKKPDA